VAEAKQEVDQRLDRFERRLPHWAARISRGLRDAPPWLRIASGGALIVAGFLGFLPLLGFWMIPLGLVLLALDLPFLRTPLIRLMDWINKKWPAPKSSSR
jgi:hypothetical protein